MKSILTLALAGLMLLGVAAGVVGTKPKAVMMSTDSGPAPTCYPTDPGCKPPLPIAR